MEKKSSRYVVAVLAVAGLLIAYPLSAGPAAVVCDMVRTPEGWAMFTKAYKPLFYFPEPFREPLREVAAWWMQCCLRWAGR